jgi:hypothetical protein
VKPIDRYKQVQAMRKQVHPMYKPASLGPESFFLAVLLVTVLTVIVLGWLGMLP